MPPFHNQPRAKKVRVRAGLDEMSEERESIGMFCESACGI